ncbi:MAG: hypothetical protein IR153_12000 [Flavobacterium sp.]|nr:hypothetical protein [Flavobacterium sp.]
MKKIASTKLVAAKFCRRVGLKIAFATLIFCSIDLSAQRSDISSGNNLPIAIENYLPKSGDSKLSKDADRFRSLANELQPAAYYATDGLKVYGKQPLVFNLDATAIEGFSSKSIKEMPSVELLRVTINKSADSKALLTEEILTLFPKLKYVFVVSTAKISSSDIAALTRNLSQDQIIIYQIASIK